MNIVSATDNFFDIETDLAMHGLAEAIVRHGLHRREVGREKLGRIATVISRSAAQPIDSGLEEVLKNLSGSEFFLIQHLVCNLIPLVDVDHRSLMRLLERLVEASGNDVAAGHPYEALREWCAVDLRRSRSIQTDARQGDALALRQLPFALMADGVEAGMEFATSAESLARRAAAIALGRMDAGNDIGRVLSILKNLARSEDEGLSLTTLRAGFDVAERSATAVDTEFENALVDRLALATPLSTHLAASLLWLHGMTIPPRSMDACFAALEEIDPEHRRTVDHLDIASATLVKAGQLDRLIDLVGRLCDRTNGKIPLAAFDSLIHTLRTQGADALGRAVVHWLRHGGTATRASLSSVLSDVGRTEPPYAVPADALHIEPGIQLALCRKAIGWFFVDPLSAIPVPLAVLRHGASEIASDVLELIFDPLILSYGGRLVDHLLAEAEAGHPRADDLRRLVERKNALHNAATGSEAISELRPSETHRETERVLWAEQMREGMRKGEEKSIFRDLFAKQYILHGRTSLTRLEYPDGSSEFAEIEMHPMSVSAELPLLSILDPAGLRHALYAMRFEPIERT